MPLTNITHDQASLRARAEAQLAREAKPPPATDADALRLLHDLQVHQIELEMQNESLRLMHAALEQAHDRFADLYDFAPVGYLTITGSGQIVEINQTAANLLGLERTQLLNTRFTRLVANDSLVTWTLLLKNSLNSHSLHTCDLMLQTTPEQTFFAHLDCVRHDRAASWLRVTLTDISARKQTDEKLRLAASVFANAREAIMITTPDGAILDTNDAFTDITGYARQEVLGCNPRLLSSKMQSKDFYTVMWQHLMDKGSWYGEITNCRKNGEVFVAWQTITTIRDEHGKAQHYVALFADITQSKEHERQLEHIAHYDLLTTLPNRTLFADRLQQAMAQTQRRQQKLVVAYIDLDGFKIINDGHGHEIGDKLLMAVANRMKQTLREGDTLARIGGDEFVAVLVDLPDMAHCLPMLGRLLEAAAEVVKIDELSVQVSASLGATIYPQNEEVDADQLLRQADHAMYQAKLAGKNRYSIFDSSMDLSIRSHHANLARMHKALLNDEFVLHYQPKLNMRSGMVVGVEALIRWQDPVRGLLMPGEFLSVVENHALAIDLGEWVIATALKQLEAWHQAGMTLTVSVNIGARQLQQSNFVERLKYLFTQHPTIKPGELSLEVLETSAIEDLRHVTDVIRQCRDFGVPFALDDFGTGYSSLTYLKRLPVSQIKIDQSFVRDMLDNDKDMAILQGVLGLAKAFGHEVIAEGVEKIEHGHKLLQLGCDLAQGYAIARPMPAGDLPAWLTARPNAAPWGSPE